MVREGDGEGAARAQHGGDRDIAAMRAGHGPRETQTKSIAAEMTAVIAAVKVVEHLGDILRQVDAALYDAKLKRG